jgi:hypothetical protein
VTPELLEWLKKAPIPVLENVIELGSLNINGSGREVIPHILWTGVDLRPGPGVDYQCRGEELISTFGRNKFDGAVCLETLEHCEDWKRNFINLWGCLKFLGICVISTPGPDFPRHDYPNDYHRFTLDIWRCIFKNQEILCDGDIYYPHNGHVIVVKKKEEISPLALADIFALDITVG